MRLSPIGIAAVIALVSCGKASSDGAANGAAVAASAAPSASSAGAAPAAGSASAASPAAKTPFRFKGAYTAKVGPVEVPKAAHEKTWTDDPGSAAIGAGALDLAVTPADGQVQGSATGALGDLLAAGTYDGKELRANLSPKDPNADNAMTGWLAAQAGDGAADGTLKGTLRVSGRDARVVREAEFTLKRE